MCYCKLLGHLQIDLILNKFEEVELCLFINAPYCALSQNFSIFFSLYADFSQQSLIYDVTSLILTMQLRGCSKMTSPKERGGGFTPL